MKKFLLVLLVFSFFFFSCGSPTESEDSGAITFTFDDSPKARWTGGKPSDDVKNQLTHLIKLKNGSYSNTVTVEPGAASHTVTGVPLGRLEVTIDAKKNGYPFAHGATVISVVKGDNTANVPMERLEQGIVLSQKSGGTYAFPPLTQGYSSGDLAGVIFAVTNYAENDTGTLTVSSNNTIFTVSPLSIPSIAQDGSAPFTVTPAANLAVGTHTATISVANTANGISASFTVSVMVAELLDVHDIASWNTAISTIKNGGKGKGYAINLTGNFSIAGVTTNTFGSVTGITVIITGNHTITLSGQGSLLRIGAKQTVILKDAHLEGNSSNNTSLVYISSGTFNMEGGTISGNTGGGVTLDGETFNMTGGTISGNTTTGGGAVTSSLGDDCGGGVYVSSGTFNMTGGTIGPNNFAINSGGGVFVDENGFFTMSGAATISGNTARRGGGVVDGGGTIDMEGGTIIDNTATLSGGGVAVYLAFNMKSGIISGNTAGSDGGGVCVYGGTATISGGTIGPGNTATYRGGGVCVLEELPGTLDLKSLDLVNGNTAGTANNPGNQVYVYDNGGTFKINGSAPSGLDLAKKDGTNYYWP